MEMLVIENAYNVVCDDCGSIGSDDNTMYFYPAEMTIVCKSCNEKKLAN